MDEKTAHAAQCSKSRALTKLIDLIPDIESFEQKCVILKDMFQSEQLKQHMVTIGIYKLLCNNAMYEHRCLENIKKIYTSSEKFDY